MDRLGKSSGRYLWVIGLMILTLPFPASAASVRITSETMARFYERDSATENDLLALPLYEYLSLAAEDPDKSGFSLHLAGWGRKNLGDDGIFTDNETGELLYGYLDWRIKDFSARLGRQTIFSGPSSQEIDGGRLRYDLGRFELTAFAGLPVSLEGEDSTSGDLAWGGAVAASPLASLRAVLSYREIRSNGQLDDEQAACDLTWDLPRGIMFNGRSAYNLKSHGFAEHDFLLSLPLEDKIVRAGYQRISYEDFFSDGDRSATPFLYLKDSGDSLDVYRASFTRGGETIEAGVSARYYDHADASRDAVYGGVLLSWHGDDLTQAGIEAGRMQSDDDRNCFTLARLFTYIDLLPLEILPLFASGDVVYALYDENINGEDYSLFISLGAGGRFLDDSFEVKVSGDYSIDPYYSDDIKSMVIVTYRWQKGGEE